MKLKHEVKLIAALMNKWNLSKYDVIDYWNNGSILVFDKSGINEFYKEAFEGFSLKEIFQAKFDDLKNKRLITIDGIYFYCEWLGQ